VAIEYAKGKTTVSAKLKVLTASMAGVLVLLGAGTLLSWQVAPLLAWDVAAVVYVVWTWTALWPLSGKLTASHAVREDPSRPAADGVVLTASLASLVAVVTVLLGASSAQGSSKLLLVALGVISVVVGWVTVHTLFALHYAELYYRDTPGGVQFDGTPQPSYKDFAYLSFTVGMTFQVSDTGFQNTGFRRAALKHSLVSYLFGTIIVATTINLVAGLIK
jgi:uncharacterized membrane protein